MIIIKLCAYNAYLIVCFVIVWYVNNAKRDFIYQMVFARNVILFAKVVYNPFYVNLAIITIFYHKINYAFVQINIFKLLIINV
jgi:hypothetical protein